MTKKFWIGLIVLMVLSPLGLILPDHFKAGAAWGEWGIDEIEKMVGYIPRGLAEFSEFWKAPLPDYAFQGWEDKGLPHLSLAYIVSAVIGIIATVSLMWLIGKILVRKNGDREK